MTKKEAAKAAAVRVALRETARVALEALGKRADTIKRRMKARGFKVPYPVHTGIGCPMQQFFRKLYGCEVSAVYAEISECAPNNVRGLHAFIRWNDESPQRRKRAA